MNPFVTPDWLAQHIDDPAVIVVDGSWHMPNSGRDAAAEYREGHIPGAVHFDIDAIADANTDLPHMLPDAQRFGELVGALGIGSQSTIVVYDSVGLFSAPRAWWSLVTMGARDVRILEGGLPAWLASGQPVETGVVPPPPARLEAHRDPSRIVDKSSVLAALGTDTQILDARPADRFAGSVPEPRPGLRSGHIPGSASVPSSLLAEDGRMKSPQALRALLSQRGVSLEAPTITSCGSGVTAATLALALEMAGAPPARVYDGSWSEWGREGDTPVER